MPVATHTHSRSIWVFIQFGYRFYRVWRFDRTTLHDSITSVYGHRNMHKWMHTIDMCIMRDFCVPREDNQNYYLKTHTPLSGCWRAESALVPWCWKIKMAEWGRIHVTNLWQARMARTVMVAEWNTRPWRSMTKLLSAWARVSAMRCDWRHLCTRFLFLLFDPIFTAFSNMWHLRPCRQ